MDAGLDQSISARATDGIVEHSISTVDLTPEISTVDSSLLEEQSISAVDSPEISAVDSVDDAPLPSDDDASPPHSAVTASVSSEVDIRAKIIKQVEYYFSDENLPNDKFLMKYVKKNKEGFVPISMIATFRKIKRLTKDSSTIVDALKESSLLVVSADAKRVKRLHPLPILPSSHPLPSSETNNPKFCTIVVENFPEDRSTENLRRIFSQAGSVKSISIHDPQVSGGANRTKSEKQISGKLHALIEYETEEAAEKAVVTLNDETDWRNGLRVQLLRNRMGHGLGQNSRNGSAAEKGAYDRVPASVKDGGKNHSNDKQNDDLDEEEGGHVSKDKNGQKGQNRSRGRKHRGTGMGHGTTSAVEPSKPPPGPRMPDGTKGFTMGRGRPPTSGNV